MLEVDKRKPVDDLSGRREAEMKDLYETLDAMRVSLAFLDAVGAPAHFGAHLDLTICRLEEHVAAQNPETQQTAKDCNNLKATVN